MEGTGLWWFASPIAVDRTEILGTRGSVAFATFDNASVMRETGGEASEFAIPHPPHVQQPLSQTVVDHLNGVGQCQSTGESAARTTRVME